MIESTIEEVEHNWWNFDEWIKCGYSFAAYRMPGKEYPCFLLQKGGELKTCSRSLGELNGRKGYVMAPFKVGQNLPIVLFTPDVRLEQAVFPEGLDAALLPLSDDYISEETDDKYAGCFNAFSTALKNGLFDKLVLSRCTVLERNRNFSLLRSFYKACCHYLYSYIYICYTPQTGLWLGSTPEIILSGRAGTWNTVALAGTMPLVDGELPRNWSPKNIEEQQYVVSYVRNQLLSVGIHAEENGPYPAFAGALSHLKTDFRFTLEDRRRLGDVLQLLHPTPAVCGLPKQEAYQFIQDNEGYDRSYYSGFVGWLDPEGQTDLYVNLRCMHIGPDLLTLYAGGGLLAPSELRDEWLETEKKLQTMKRII